MGIGKEKNPDELGGGKGQEMDRWLVEIAHGFYEPAKIQHTRIAKRVHRGTRVPRLYARQ